MTGRLLALKRLYGGTLCGRTLTLPTFGHPADDRGTSVTEEPSAPGGLLVRVHNGSRADDLVAKDEFLRVLGETPVRPRRGERGGASIQRPRSAEHRRERDIDAETEQRTARALAIWHKSVEPRSTPVTTYLASRGLILPDEAAGEAVRFHPACPFAEGARTPAMVCLVRDVVTNAPKAIHRTALDLQGRKITVGEHSRLSFGPVGGGAIKLTPDEDVGLCLGVGEGMESALSLRLVPAFGASPVWSLISAGGVERLPVLAGVESLWLAVDHDEAGVRASEACAERWQQARAETFLVTPRADRADLNDVFRDRTHA